MRVYTLKPPRTLPAVKTTSWDGVTYFSGFPSASATENIPVHGPGTYYPIDFTLPEIYKLLFCTQLAVFSLDAGGSVQYDDGTYIDTYSYSGLCKLPLARNVECIDYSPPVHPLIQPFYIKQNQEYKVFFDDFYGVGVGGNSTSINRYPTPTPAVEVDWAGFTDDDNLESAFKAAYTPANLTSSSTDPNFDTETYSFFLYGSARLLSFSVGDDGKYYLGISFSATLPSGPTLTSLKSATGTYAGSFTIGGKTVDFYKDALPSGWSDYITASASISILSYLEYNPGDGFGPIWDKSTGALLRQPYA